MTRHVIFFSENFSLKNIDAIKTNKGPVALASQGKPERGLVFN